MLKRFSMAAMAFTLAAGMGLGQSNTHSSTPLNRTSPANGKQMFISYCASCHGSDGKGNGPVAATLKIPPADLTALSKNNHGVFPEAHVISVLQYGTAISSHGTAQMPIWGPLLGNMEKPSPQVQKLRESNLVRYLETIQAK
jgi:mono/diheme cytochrome c family protein